MVAEIGLYCGKNWARVIIQSISPLGSFIGLLIMNVISDTRGRRQAFLISLAISIFAVLRIFFVYIQLLYMVEKVEIFFT
jgi:MFS family permease